MQKYQRKGASFSEQNGSGSTGMVSFWIQLLLLLACARLVLVVLGVQSDQLVTTASEW